MSVSASVKINKLFISLIIFSVLFFSSCLDIETDISLETDGSAAAVLRYRFSPEAADFGRGFGSDEPWPFPLTEEDFFTQTLRHPGVEVLRYRNWTDSDGSEGIEVKLKADSLESLSGYLGFDMAVRTDGDTGSLRIEFPFSENYREADSRLRESIDRIIGDSVLRMSFSPPSSPKTGNPGIVDGGKAVLELSLKDILHQEEAIFWSVDW
jgi:hypothetical protein